MLLEVLAISGGQKVESDNDYHILPGHVHPLHPSARTCSNTSLPLPPPREFVHETLGPHAGRTDQSLRREMGAKRLQDLARKPTNESREPPQFT